MTMIQAYKLCFRTPVSVFSGLGIAGLVDRIVTRNSTGLPCIPGSTIKGRWRFFAERLLRSGVPVSPKLKIHGVREPWCKDHRTACTLCRLFGNPALAAMLQVGQAELKDKKSFEDILKQNVNPVVHPDAEIRPGIALSRHRRVAIPDHLFFDEAIPAVNFEGQLVLLSEQNPNSDDPDRINQEILFLKMAGRLVDSLGARKMVGRGSLENGIVVIEG